MSYAGSGGRISPLSPQGITSKQPPVIPLKDASAIGPLYTGLLEGPPNTNEFHFCLIPFG